jgi:murein DD-endopeptidase MepM/ murein hydrolase activator NlpD
MRAGLAACGLALALAGCAVSNTPYPRPVASYPPRTVPAPPGPSIYATAPRAPLHSELFACSTSGSNRGEIGYRGESVLYSPYITTSAGPLLRNPTQAACLSSGFGWRGSADGGGRMHNGLDLANPDGGFVYAAADGWVAFADWRNGYGYTLELDHGRNVRTMYAHLSEIDPSLAPGSFVSAGAPVARMGMTGNATGIHLHYEVWVDGMLVDPLSYGRPPVYVSAPAPEEPLLPEPEFTPEKPAH